jgi:integrase
MGECGLRCGEVAGLKLGRIDREDRSVHVVETVTEVGGKLAADTPKSAASRRTIPITHSAYAALLAHLALELCGPEDYLLHTTSWAPLGFRRLAWDPAVRAAKLPAGVSPHCLRHSYATWLLDAGVPIQTVRKLLGHALIATPQIYVHSNAAQDRTAIDQVERLLSASA